MTNQKFNPKVGDRVWIDFFGPKEKVFDGMKNKSKAYIIIDSTLKICISIKKLFPTKEALLKSLEK